MASAVILPRQGQSVESCIISQWHKQVGDPVKTGDILFSYETDKASFEEAAKEDGVLLAIFYEEDSDVPVLSAVAVIGQPGEDYASLTPQGAAPAKKAEAPAEEAAKPAVIQTQTAQAPATVNGAGVSPRARATAERIGVDAALAIPTGPQGRIIERDVYAIRSQGAAAPAESAAAMPAAAVPQAVPGGPRTYQDVKLTNIRKVIARTMHESLSTMAQLTHHTSFDATQVMSLREQFKQSPEEAGLRGITINDLILFAVSRTLMQHPDMNAHFLGDSIRRYDHVHLGMAVDTPRGLLVPTLYDADLKSLREISATAKELGKAAQAGSINPDLLTEGTFTVTNLGSLGIEHFTPIINPPQVGILGVDCVIQRVRTVNGQVTAYPAMGLSLTYDHRAVDGAPASRFLKDLVTALENYGVLLAN